MDFQTAVKTCLNKYADFNGRARRSEFWFFYLFYVIVYVVAMIIGGVLGDTIGGILTLLIIVALIIPTLAGRCTAATRYGPLRLVAFDQLDPFGWCYCAAGVLRSARHRGRQPVRSRSEGLT